MRTSDAIRHFVRHCLSDALLLVFLMVPAAAQDGAAWRACVTEQAFKLDDKRSDAATIARAIEPQCRAIGAPVVAADVEEITAMVLRLRVVAR